MPNVGEPVPQELRHARFQAVPLTAAVAARDYSAYMASPEVIRVHSDGRWPLAGFTYADDLELVALHEADHLAGRAFAFTLLSPSGAESLGCLYVNPLREFLRHESAESQWIDSLPERPVMVTFWLRADQQDSDLADVVVAAVDQWLHTHWPIDLHLFRVLPDELTSRRALARQGLKEIEVPLPDDARPYLWFASPEM